MLELPDGLEVRALTSDFVCDGLMVKVVGDMLPEVPAGFAAPQLPIPSRTYLVDTAPLMDALRTLHYEVDDGSAAGAVCFHCEDPWPCPTMTVAEESALKHPVVWRRLKVELPEEWRP